MSGMYGQFRSRSNISNMAVPEERTSLLGTSSQTNMHPAWLSISSIIAAILSSNPVASVLLIFTPIGLLAPSFGWSPPAIFALNFLSLVALGHIFNIVLLELTEPIGQTLQDFVLGLFGYPTFLIVTAFTLETYGAPLVQASIFGSIIFHNLAVLGCCFLVYGLQYREQPLDGRWGALMTLILMSLIFPSLPSFFISSRGSAAQSPTAPEPELVLISHVIAPVLLILYLVFLLFQSRTHTHLFRPDEEVEREEQEESVILAHWSGPFVTIILAIGLVAATAGSAKYLVDSLGPLFITTGISKASVGYVLLPILFYIQSLSLSVVAWKGRPDLVITVSISDMLYTLLFGYPFLVIVGWIQNVEITFHSSPFGIVMASVTCLAETGLMLSGSVNYLPGIFCIAAYAFFVFVSTLHVDPSLD
ncbi:hypothetical protein BJX63DRAFT_214932 [Aspergillus granulosus]|uniref:Sodium/calcium exchanger membrane region domain-containing protein n=1 Tax=Aspergillus granulosus TaxID=176169 RepID=A0ABR4HFI8_9EURO